MRLSAPALIAATLFCAGSAAATETLVRPQPNVAPTLTVEQPVNPMPTKDGGPTLVSVGVRLGPPSGNMMPPELIIPDFHFLAPNGNAVLLHRDVIESSANNLHVNPSAPINVPAEAQKKGATVSGGFNCNRGQYHVTMSAYILDSDGNRSNAVQYTIHCNGG